MFSKIDDWLFDRVFEKKIAHWFQRWTGKTNFFLAKVSISIGCLVMSLPKGSLPLNLSVLVAFYCLVLLILFLGVIISFEKRYEEIEMKESAINISRLRDRPIRFISVVSAIALVVFSTEQQLLQLMFWIPFLSTTYFLACTPLPPGTSKCRQKWNSLLAKINSALAPSPTLVPIPVSGR